MVLHYNNVQILVKDVYKNIFNEKCHPPPPLDDPSLADLGTERVWPGLYLRKNFRIGRVKKNMTPN